MNNDRFFCAAASRSNGESIYGTVARIQSWLLVEHPAFWRRHAVEESPSFSPRFKAYVYESEARGVFDRTLLIRREHRRSESMRAFFVRSPETGANMSEVQFCSYEELPSIQGQSEPVQSVLYAVCTHGRHDKCCARFGLPVYRTLREVVGRAVWECSHVGGDRFAANVVVFPHGLYYGHVTPQDVPDLVRSTERGQVWLKGYRGRSSFPRRIQIAEYFARVESGRLRIDEFGEVRAVEQAESVSVQLRSHTDGTVHHVVYRRRQRLLAEYLTCSALQPSAVPQYELVDYDVRPS